MSLEMTLNFEQDAFLANIINKQHFIELLIPILRQLALLVRFPLEAIYDRHISLLR